MTASPSGHERRYRRLGIPRPVPAAGTAEMRTLTAAMAGSGSEVRVFGVADGDERPGRGFDVDGPRVLRRRSHPGRALGSAGWRVTCGP